MGREEKVIEYEKCLGCGTILYENWVYNFGHRCYSCLNDPSCSALREAVIDDGIRYDKDTPEPVTPTVRPSCGDCGPIQSNEVVTQEPDLWADLRDDDFDSPF